MKINGKEIKHDEYLTPSQAEYLDKRFETLENYLNSKYDYAIDIEKSRQSESRYISIPTTTENGYQTTHEISIRNHNTYCAESGNVHQVIYLRDYETWTSLKKELFNIIGKYINN